MCTYSSTFQVKGQLSAIKWIPTFASTTITVVWNTSGRHIYPECLAVVCQRIGPTGANIYQCLVVSEAQQQRHRVLGERQTTFSRQHNGGVTTWFPSKKMQNLNPPFNTQDCPFIHSAPQFLSLTILLFFTFEQIITSFGTSQRSKVSFESVVWKGP